jgi:hypothetical protein
MRWAVVLIASACDAGIPPSGAARPMAPIAQTVTNPAAPGKTVYHYYGDDSAPEQLVDLEYEVDEIIGTTEYVYGAGNPLGTT